MKSGIFLVDRDETYPVEEWWHPSDPLPMFESVIADWEKSVATLTRSMALVDGPSTVLDATLGAIQASTSALIANTAEQLRVNEDGLGRTIRLLGWMKNLAVATF